MKTINQLKLFRDASGFTQEQVAAFLDIERGALSNYELGSREVPMQVLISLSNLYGVDIADFYEQDKTKLKYALCCSFRLDNLSADDLMEIADFKDVVKSYLKMVNLTEHD